MENYCHIQGESSARMVHHWTQANVEKTRNKENKRINWNMAIITLHPRRRFEAKQKQSSLCHIQKQLLLSSGSHGLFYKNVTGIIDHINDKPCLSCKFQSPSALVFCLPSFDWVTANGREKHIPAVTVFHWWKLSWWIKAHHIPQRQTVAAHMYI